MSIRSRSLGFRLATDNNARCAAMWVIAVAWLLVNIFVFGFGSPTGFGGERSFLAEASSDVGVVPFFGWFWGWMRFLSWWGWVLWVPATAIYTPIAFRDEVARAAERFRAKRGVGAQTSAPATGAGAPAGRPMFLRDFLKWDFIVEAVLAIGGRLFGRR